VPPLRARPGDVEDLAARFARTHLGRSGEPASFEPPALARLAAEKWPGNVRQLQNFVERVVVLSDAADITLADVDRELRRGIPQAAQEPQRTTLEAAVQQAGRDAVKDALTRANGNKTLAARILGVSRRALYYKLEELGLP
jgi:DNA-binding NtrC family response regulator